MPSAEFLGVKQRGENVQELKNDPLGIFRHLTKLHHNLVLASAYSAAAENCSSDAGSQKQRRCLDAKFKEPKVGRLPHEKAACLCMGTP